MHGWKHGNCVNHYLIAAMHGWKHGSCVNHYLIAAMHGWKHGSCVNHYLIAAMHAWLEACSCANNLFQVKFFHSLSLKAVTTNIS